MVFHLWAGTACVLGELCWMVISININISIRDGK